MTAKTEGRDLVLAKIDTARVALYEATTIPEVKRFVDIAATAQTWARQQKLGKEVIGYAHALEVEALHKLGKMLAKAPKNAGARGKGKSGVPLENPTLLEFGVDKKTSHVAQLIAALPREQFEALKDGTTTLTKAIREVEHGRRPTIALPSTGKHRVIYADPPWHYGNSGLSQYGHASHHYPPMTIAELCALNVQELADDDAVLFLWVTSPLLEKCFAVISAWGFKYKSSFVWDKVDHNFGHYNSVRHEFLLICTRGSCTPDIKTLHDSVQSIERSGKHSEKPEHFRALIDELYPRGSRIELFSRRDKPVKGWVHWGNEPS